LPPQWTAVDPTLTERRAREVLRDRFAACYPFHPATLSVFQRKWQSLPQYQQTRGTLGMLAQWLSRLYASHHQQARAAPLITLGSAPLEDRSFRATILGQLGEPRLNTAIEADLAADTAHARALDAETQGALTDIHRQVGTAILFECSG
jgi:predicted AAA+ superfamily ATPase